MPKMSSNGHLRVLFILLCVHESLAFIKTLRKSSVLDLDAYLSKQIKKLMIMLIRVSHLDLEHTPGSWAGSRLLPKTSCSRFGWTRPRAPLSKGLSVAYLVCTRVQLPCSLLHKRTTSRGKVTQSLNRLNPVPVSCVTVYYLQTLKRNIMVEKNRMQRNMKDERKLRYLAASASSSFSCSRRSRSAFA